MSATASAPEMKTLFQHFSIGLSSVPSVSPPYLSSQQLVKTTGFVRVPQTLSVPFTISDDIALTDPSFTITPGSTMSVFPFGRVTLSVKQ